MPVRTPAVIVRAQPQVSLYTGEQAVTTHYIQHNKQLPNMIAHVIYDQS